MAFWITALVLFILQFFPGSSSDPGSLPNKKGCEFTTGRALTVIKSIEFPEPYGPNVDCRYVIRRRSDNMCSVTFLFNVLDVEYTPGCSGDFLIFEGTGERLCGAKPVGFSRTLSFKKDEDMLDSGKTSKKLDEVVMNFHSGNASKSGGSRLGYMVTVVQQECPRPTCDAIYEEDEFEFKTPNYPLPYDNGQTCAFTVHRSGPMICRLSLTVKHFELEEDEHCYSDFLKLSDGRRLCGTLKEGQIIEVDFYNDTMVMEFQSDHFATRSGFDMDAQQIDCSDVYDSSTAPVEQKKTTDHLATMPTSSVLAQTATAADPANETVSTATTSSITTTPPTLSSNSSEVL